jgi:hypothetical protein
VGEAHAARLLDPRRGLRQLVDPAAADRDAPTPGREPLRDRLPDAGTRTGDGDDPAGLRFLLVAHRAAPSWSWPAPGIEPVFDDDDYDFDDAVEQLSMLRANALGIADDTPRTSSAKTEQKRAR